MTSQAIALVSHNLEINGANNFLLMLASVIQKNFSVSVFSPKNGKMADKYQQIGVSVNLFEDPLNFDFLYDFDAIFVNTLMMSRVVLESQRRNIPHALVVHETWHPERLEYYLDELWHIEDVKKTDIVEALQSSQKVVFPAKYLADVYKSLVDNDRVSTIYCAIDMDKIDSYINVNSKSEVRKKLDIGQDEIVFLQMGTVTRRKAQLMSVQAFDLMCKRLPDGLHASLLLVGARYFRPGERQYIEDIKMEVLKRGISDRVRIIEVDEDPLKYFLASDVLLHPSINEVMPLVILEAAYCGLPLVVSGLDGIPELFRSGHDAMLVNPYDVASIGSAMLALAIDPMLRKNYGLNARHTVANKHDIFRFSNTYNDLLSDMLSSGCV